MTSLAAGVAHWAMVNILVAMFVVLPALYVIQLVRLKPKVAAWVAGAVAYYSALNWIVQSRMLSGKGPLIAVIAPAVAELAPIVWWATARAKRERRERWLPPEDAP